MKIIDNIKVIDFIAKCGTKIVCNGGFANFRN
jgi:hypothetical protein